MPNYNLNPTIRPVQFNLGQVQFTPYTPQVSDANILANSLAKIEARQEKATERMSGIDQALGRIGEQLHNDEETQTWFNKYKQEVKDKIWHYASMGDYGEAIRQANLMAGQIAQDNRLKNRVQANTNYQNQVKIQEQRKANGQISQKTLDWWKANHPYTYSENTDDAGNVTNWNEMDYDVPVNDIDWAKEAATAFQLVSENSKSVTTGSSTSKQSSGVQRVKDGKRVNGATTNSAGQPTGYDYTYSTGHSSSSQTSNSVHYKTAASIQDVMNLMKERNPDAYAAMRQQFRVEHWEYDREKEKLDNMSQDDPKYSEQAQYVRELEKRSERNGSADIETFFKNTMEKNGFAVRLSYYNTASSNITSSSNSNSLMPNIGASNGAAGGYGQNVGAGGAQQYVNGQAIQGPHVVANEYSPSVANFVQVISSLLGNSGGFPSNPDINATYTDSKGTTWTYGYAGWMKKSK